MTVLRRVRVNRHPTSSGRLQSNMTHSKICSSSKFPFLLFTAGVCSLVLACSDDASDDAGSDDDKGAGGTNDGGVGGTPAGDGDAGEDELRGSCKVDERVGNFVTYLGGSDRSTVLDGSIAQVVVPSAVPELLLDEGECRLLGPQNLFCSESCAFGMVCAGDDECVPEREALDAGTVTITGLEADFSSEPNGITLKYSGSFSDPYPGFVQGSAIELSTAGGAIEGFSLRARGVSPIETALNDVPVASGNGVALTWEATGVDRSQSEVFVNFQINTHGATTGWIECVGEDDGEMEIPEPLITRLMTMGLSGFPRMTLTRRSVDSVHNADGCVQLSIESSMDIDLVVDGVTSCTKAEDCPEGQSCDEAELWCVDE